MTEDDPIYVRQFFEVFLAEYPRDELELVGVTVQRAFGESTTATARRVLRTYGASGFVRLGLRTTAAKLRGRTIEGLCERAGIPLVPTVSVNDPEYVRRVRALGPDVIVSVAAPEIFKAEILNSAPLGCVNIHSGRLPSYRGMMPNFWQMLNGEREATVTVHGMSEKIDAGAVLGTINCPIAEHDVLDRVISETKREGARLLIRVLGELARGEATRNELDSAGGSYYSFPTGEDVSRFRRRGHRLL